MIVLLMSGICYAGFDFDEYNRKKAEVPELPKIEIYGTPSHIWDAGWVVSAEVKKNHELEIIRSPLKYLTPTQAITLADFIYEVYGKGK